LKIYFFSDLSDPIFAQSPDAVQKEKDRLDGSLDPKFEQLNETQSRFTEAFTELSSFGRDVNLPDITGEGLVEKLQKLKERREEHTEKLESMLDDAVQNDALCQEFAEQAKVFREDCARQTSEANTTEKTLEEQLDAVKKAQAEFLEEERMKEVRGRSF
jgi:hypothetical protein